MSDIEMSESDSHASQQGNSQGPDLSEWDQLMNNLTTQLENSFYITDDPFVLLSEPRDHEHREPRQQLSSEENSDISLDSSPGTPGQNHFQQPHPYPLSSPDISPRSFKPITLTLTLGLPSGSGLVGILKKHREKKPSKRVKFAPTPSKIVKAYRSGQGKSVRPNSVCISMAANPWCG
ncbi:hypothetical protein BO71DRAFT_395923 [Aspergillus ellipticus CBS 707.79]|uniref:Uncharacterized protein n=1 Tax=Aspergillus ellipticus CBS 707.79 TaxID=1448320 RepID=A0A319DJG9_9EURO|nr:hypothetical protein BO71DRAFT_395923 [Aspergillus ellipticus CBS 707.79]